MAIIKFLFLMVLALSHVDNCCILLFASCNFMKHAPVNCTSSLTNFTHGKVVKLKLSQTMAGVARVVTPALLYECDKS